MMSATPDAAAWWRSGLVLSRNQVLSACAVPRVLAFKHNSRPHRHYQGVNSCWNDCGASKGSSNVNRSIGCGDGNGSISGCANNVELGLRHISRTQLLFEDVVNSWNENQNMSAF